MAKFRAVTAAEARMVKMKAPMWLTFQLPSEGVTKNDLYCSMVSTSLGPPRSAGMSLGWKLSTTM